ncbi:MAG: DUF4446 family protein [Lachnospiraceae bacterium]|nr:DUF4446 family protein [Lachnospiraceae bacterium]
MILFDNPILFIIIVILVAMSAAAIIFAIIAFGKYSELNKRYEMFMTGKDAESLEEYFLDLQQDIDHLIEDNNKNKDSIRKLNRITKRTFQKVGFYKYDAFEEKTGKRSFALALLDFTNTGFVVTCQSHGDGTIIFIKDVEVGTTSTKLGPEEEKALEIAMGQRDKYED